MDQEDQTPEYLDGDLDAKGRIAPESNAPTSLGRTSRIQRWVAAVVVILLLGIAYGLLPKYEAAFYRDTYPGIISNPGNLRANRFDPAAYELALDAYQRKAYPLCIQVLSGQPAAPANGVLLGSAYLLDQQPAASIPVLEPVLSDALHLEYARWLLALAHLHLGQEPQAERYLQAIVDDSARHYKRAEAQTILTQLGRFWR